MAEAPNGRDHFDATLGGQRVGIRSATPVVLVLLVCVVPLLIWLIQKERKELVDQFMATLTTIAKEHREDTKMLRDLAEAHHHADMARQLEIARAWLRVLGWVAHNSTLAPEEKLPFGAIPPSMEEQLRKQLPVD